MTWLEMPKILDRLVKETTDTLCARKLDVSVMLRVSSSLRTTSMHDEEGNRRIARFASDFRWPEDTSEEFLIECYTRLHQAKELVQFVLSSANEIPMNHTAHGVDLPDEMLIHWLLIDYWHHAGIWRQVFQLYTAGRRAI